jgi:hypothetical protein
MKMNNTMTVNDLKLAAFLRTVTPNSFQGIERTASGQVGFLFTDDEVHDLVSQYLREAQFTFSPLKYAHQLDECKRLIFQDYRI